MTGQSSSEQHVASASADAPANETARSAINRGTVFIILLLLLSLTWYISADRLTPLTTQARVVGNVVGISPQVAGPVVSVPVSDNDVVAHGDLLFRIDPTDYEIALTRAVAERDKAMQQLLAGDATITAARAGLDAALAAEDKQRKGYDRLQRLFQEDPGTVSERRLEAAEASLASASAQVAAARADVERAIESKGGLDNTNNAFMASVEAAVSKATRDLAHTEVRSPISGIVADAQVAEGQFVATGRPVMTMIGHDALWIEAAFTENNLAHIQSGTSVKLLFDSVPGHLYEGQVTSVAYGVGTGPAAPPGSMPSISNDRDWLRQAQRFNIRVSWSSDDMPPAYALRVGGQVSVVAFTDNAPVFMRWLAELSLSVRSIASYAY